MLWLWMGTSTPRWRVTQPTYHQEVEASICGSGACSAPRCAGSHRVLFYTRSQLVKAERTYFPRRNVQRCRHAGWVTARHATSPCPTASAPSPARHPPDRHCTRVASHRHSNHASMVHTCALQGSATRLRCAAWLTWPTKLPAMHARRSRPPIGLPGAGRPLIREPRPQHAPLLLPRAPAARRAAPPRLAATQAVR
jgi:hypothetical protein